VTATALSLWRSPAWRSFSVYSGITLALLIASGALTRWAFVANGLLAPFLILQLVAPKLIYVGALWLITFPLSVACLANDFARSDHPR